MSWIENNLAVFTALVAAFGAIFGAIVSAGAKFLFEFYLSEVTRHHWDIVKVKRRYSAPIIRAVDDLSGRIENLNRFLKDGRATTWLRKISEEERAKVPFERYYAVSTIYLFVRMIAWIEVLKREQIFLDFSSIDETRRFNFYLELIYQAISMGDLTSKQPDRENQNHWIFWHYLSGIGDAVLTKEDGALRCLSFEEFCEKYKKDANSTFNDWMQEVERFFVDLTSGPEDQRWKRIQILWFCLDCFLDFVDPDKLRISRPRLMSQDIAPQLKSAAVGMAEKLGLPPNLRTNH